MAFISLFKVVLHYEHREEGEEVNLFQEQEITLNKKAGKGLGISLVGRRDGPGVFVSALVSILIIFITHINQ